MVESFLVSKLDTIPELSGQIYPTAAPVGSCQPPFAIYTMSGSVPTRDLYGDVVYILDTIRVDLYGDDCDVLCVLAAAAENAVFAECEEYGDIYIFSSSSARGEPDGFDMNMELHRKTLSVAVRYWR